MNFGTLLVSVGLFWAGALVLLLLQDLLSAGRVGLAAAIMGPALGAAVLYTLHDREEARSE